MSIPYRQRRLLRRIDHSLRQSDPDLQSMLLIFARLNAGEQMPAWEQLPGAEAGSRHMVWPTEMTPYPGPFFFLDGGGRSASQSALGGLRFGFVGESADQADEAYGDGRADQLAEHGDPPAP
jgi:hypothetical protein